MSLTDLSLVDVNISAAQTFDRYHLNELNLRFASKRIVRLSPREDLVDQWTVDRQTAFQIGWDLNLIPLIQQRLIQQSEKVSFQFIDRSFFTLLVLCRCIRAIRRVTFIPSIGRSIVMINVFSIILSM